jgi:alkaline phosphatase D
VISGSYFWVGSEAQIRGYRPAYTKKYEHEFPYGQRIDSVIAWLQKPQPVRPRLILWYLDEPDRTGHAFGPDSPETDSVVMVLDSLLGVFLAKLEALDIAEKVNVIVTSDHGMGSISDDRKAVLEDHLDMAWVKEIQGYNPNLNIGAQEGFIDSIYLSLVNVEGIHVWKSGKLPERLHYGDHPRTLDLVVLADSSWSVVVDKDESVGRGAHGFDNDNTDMHGIFYAFGPAFHENYASPVFSNVDIYPLICEILGLKPETVDGKLENVKGLLK